MYPHIFLDFSTLTLKPEVDRNRTKCGKSIAVVKRSYCRTVDILIFLREYFYLLVVFKFLFSFEYERG